MIPYKMLNGHDPEKGIYGDCIRTCIASLLDMGPIAVPHFAHDNPDPETVWDRVKNWLQTQGFGIWFQGFDGSTTLDEILEQMNAVNHGVYYLLAGSNGAGDHVVIGLNDDIVHDPSRFGVGLRKPGSTGIWMVAVLVPSAVLAK